MRGGAPRVRVCVVGPGALGCLHAAWLARAGVQVCLLDHRPDRARALAARGLVVEDGGSTWTARLPCAADPAELPPVDLLLFCVKTFQSATAAAHAAPLVGPETILVRLQNGLADPAPLVDLASGARVVLGVSGHGAHTVSWGRIRHAGSGPTRLGPLIASGRAAAEAAAAALRPALPDIEVVHD
ncbi:MAG: hypothetical protein FJX74_13670, partial [Armatimonadetes bacterium]|nr:hypothetical protein [Armatimonadota bacterium]